MHAGRDRRQARALTPAFSNKYRPCPRALTFISEPRVTVTPTVWKEREKLKLAFPESRFEARGSICIYMKECIYK